MPAVVQMEARWTLEFGMPSTHAMAGLSVPLAFFVFSAERYPVEPLFASLITIVWTSLVGSSRIYLGMHSVADVVAGVLLALLLLPLLVLLTWLLDGWLVRCPLTPLMVLPLSLLVICLYPTPARWTPGRGEATSILGSYMGVLIGFWTNYQLGFLSELSATNAITFDQWTIAKMLIRSIVAGLLGVLAKKVSKPILIRVACSAVGLQPEEYQQGKKDQHSKQLVVELFYKFVSYLCMAVNIVFLAPLILSVIGVGRPSFYNEL